MTTLQEAWDWYKAVGEAARLLGDLGRGWDGWPWDAIAAAGPIPTRLRRTTGTDLTRTGSVVNSVLEDVAVFVLFSVFEAAVRDAVLEQIRPQIEQLRHPALQSASKELEEKLSDGSFAQVLNALKGPASVDLIEQVHQVRRYRNWVAHGRRPDRKPNEEIDPKSAYDRLKAFLELIRGFASDSRSSGE